VAPRRSKTTAFAGLRPGFVAPSLHFWSPYDLSPRALGMLRIRHRHTLLAVASTRWPIPTTLRRATGRGQPPRLFASTVPPAVRWCMPRWTRFGRVREYARRVHMSRYSLGVPQVVPHIWNVPMRCSRSPGWLADGQLIPSSRCDKSPEAGCPAAPRVRRGTSSDRTPHHADRVDARDCQAGRL
jgi:hypothetical protein